MPPLLRSSSYILVLAYVVLSTKAQITDCLEMNPDVDVIGMKTCKKCSNTTALTVSGYQCIPCSAPCLSCYGLPTLCLSCSKGYRLEISSHACISCPAGAEKCTADSIVSCLPSYYYSNSSKTCEYCPANCLECETSTTCTKCMEEFVKQTIRGSILCAVNDQQELKLLTFFVLFGSALTLFILLCISALCRYNQTKKQEVNEIEEHNTAMLVNILKQIELLEGMSSIKKKFGRDTH